MSSQQTPLVEQQQQCRRPMRARYHVQLWRAGGILAGMGRDIMKAYLTFSSAEVEKSPLGRCRDFLSASNVSTAGEGKIGGDRAVFSDRHRWCVGRGGVIVRAGEKLSSIESTTYSHCEAGGDMAWLFMAFLMSRRANWRSSSAKAMTRNFSGDRR